MKSLIIVFVCLTAKAIGKNETKERCDKNDRYFSFPGDGDNFLHIIDSCAPVDIGFIQNYEENPNNNVYYLYTRTNPTDAQILVINDTDSVTKSNFKGEKEVAFLVHGWLGHRRNYFNFNLTKSFLESKDINVIVLDWSKLARHNYVTAKFGVPIVGAALGQFITWLTKFGASYNKVHLVGFSLGAHLVGNAGRETGARIKRITALDPAGPLWGNDPKRIVKTDALYVEVIHTNTVLFGFADPCGHADFYPNGGASMPGCWLNICSHSRSYEYMAATVRYNHLYGRRCCEGEISHEKCSGYVFPMGNNNLLKYGSGIYFVTTGKDYPF